MLHRADSALSSVAGCAASRLYGPQQRRLRPNAAWWSPTVPGLSSAAAAALPTSALASPGEASSIPPPSQLRWWQGEHACSGTLPSPDLPNDEGPVYRVGCTSAGLRGAVSLPLSSAANHDAPQELVAKVRHDGVWLGWRGRGLCACVRVQVPRRVSDLPFASTSRRLAAHAHAAFF